MPVLLMDVANFAVARLMVEVHIVSFHWKIPEARDHQARAIGGGPDSE